MKRQASVLAALNASRTRIATSYSLLKDTEKAAKQAYSSLLEILGKAPSAIVVGTTCLHDGVLLAKTLAELTGGKIPTIGCTSCGGVMTEKGFHSNDGSALALWGVLDAGGLFGVGISEKGDDPEASAAEAASAATAGLNGEDPDLVWIMGSPGGEEDVLRGIQTVVGDHVPVATLAGRLDRLLEMLTAFLCRLCWTCFSECFSVTR